MWYPPQKIWWLVHSRKKLAHLRSPIFRTAIEKAPDDPWTRESCTPRNPRDFGLHGRLDLQILGEIYGFSVDLLACYGWFWLILRWILADSLLNLVDFDRVAPTKWSLQTNKSWDFNPKRIGMSRCRSQMIWTQIERYVWPTNAWENVWFWIANMWIFTSKTGAEPQWPEMWRQQK